MDETMGNVVSGGGHPQGTRGRTGMKESGGGCVGRRAAIVDGGAEQFEEGDDGRTDQQADEGSAEDVEGVVDADVDAGEADGRGDPEPGPPDPGDASEEPEENGQSRKVVDRVG